MSKQVKKVVTAFPMDFITKITEVLNKEKARLEKELGTISAGGDSANFPEYGDKEDENANEVAEYAANLTIEESLERSYRDVVKALARLEKGEYGVCRYCGKPIDSRRLLARPTSSACVDCKKTITQEV